MGMSRTLAVVIGAALAVLLQVVVAPAMAIGGIVPNFLLAYALAVVLARPHALGVVLPVVLGLLFDLLGGGPVGAMGLFLLLATLAVKRLYLMLDNDTLFIPLGLLVAAVFCVELLYAVLLVVCGFPVALGQALLLRGLPCALYDTVLAVALFLIMRFVLGRIEARQHELPLVR